MGEVCGRGLWEKIMREDWGEVCGRGPVVMVCNIVMKWCDNNEYSYFSLI